MLYIPGLRPLNLFREARRAVLGGYLFWGLVYQFYLLAQTIVKRLSDDQNMFQDLLVIVLGCHTDGGHT